MAALYRILLLFLLIGVVILSGCTAQQSIRRACTDTCDDGDKCTKDYCSCATDSECKRDRIDLPPYVLVDAQAPCATNCECKHDRIAPCEGNRVCENGENPNFASLNPKYGFSCQTDIYNVTWWVRNDTALNYRLDCPETCDDFDNTTADYYNFTSQRCEHYKC